MADTAEHTAPTGDPTHDAPPAPEVVQPEVVQPAPPADAEPDQRDVPRMSQLERAAEAAMNMPGVPGREEFLSLAMQARILSMSAGAPKAVRGNPWLAFHLAMIGRDLNISPSSALQLVDVIGYREDLRGDAAYENVQLSLSPELMNAQVRRMGLGMILPGYRGLDRAVAVALLPDGRLDPRCGPRLPDAHWPNPEAPGEAERAAAERGEVCRCVDVLGAVEFTWADAQQAGLVDAGCRSATEHTAMCTQGGNGSRGKRCHQGYRAYPKRMLWWRAAGWLQSDFFPEASLGLYSPEELGAVVDADGRPVDPGDVELPTGYEPKQLPPDPGDDLLADAEQGSELAEERADLRARLDAITAAGEGARQALRDLWTQTTEDGERKTPAFDHLRRRHLVRARALVKSIEDRITKGDWGDDAKRAWADASAAGAGFQPTDGTPPEHADADVPRGTAVAAQEAPAADPAAGSSAEPDGDASGEQAAPSVAELAANLEQSVQAARDARRASSDVAEPEQPDPEAMARAEVAQMNPTEVLARLSHMVQDGTAVPRKRDDRVELLVRLLTDEYRAEQAADAEHQSTCPFDHDSCQAEDCDCECHSGEVQLAIEAGDVDPYTDQGL